MPKHFQAINREIVERDHPGVTSGTLKVKRLKTSWSNVRYAQNQKIEKHPGVTSGTLKVKRLKNTGCFLIC
jgi:hypothetical protein